MQGNHLLATPRGQHPSITVVIPTYNEAENLPLILPYIPPIVNEIILVDGHSTDNTVAIAQQLVPNIRIIQQNGKGKGDALRTAFATCTSDIIITLDADGSNDPLEIPRFIDALQWGYDFAKGSRFLTGAHTHDISLPRRLGNRVLSRLVNFLFGTHFSDLCYGYNAFWKHSLHHLHIDRDGFEIETLISLRLHKAHLKIVEVPSFEHRRVHGRSKLHPLRDGWQIFITILKEWSSHDKSGYIVDTAGRRNRFAGFATPLNPVTPIPGPTIELEETGCPQDPGQGQALPLQVDVGADEGTLAGTLSLASALDYPLNDGRTQGHESCLGNRYPTRVRINNLV